ncbi:hypothetical protein D3C84_846180 [compost metagenome]
MVRIFQADQNVQAVLAQRLGQELHGIAHLGGLPGQVITRDVFVFQRQLDPIGSDHAHGHGEAVHRDLLQRGVLIERR